MAEVRLYQLQRQSLDDVLPVMLGGALERGRRAVVMATSPERVEALNARLWTYDDHGFLPHGSKPDGYAEMQPIWLTAEDENPNGATALFLTDGAHSQRIAAYELVCLLFDGNEPSAVAAARAAWRELREAGHALTFWQQSPEGGWTQRAEA